MDLYKLFRLGVLKTIWYNFKVLPFKQALHFPIVLARNVRIGACRRGCIKIQKGGSFHVGFLGSAASCSEKSLLHIEGDLILKGEGFHSFAPGTIIRIAEGGCLQIGNNYSCHRNGTFLVNKSVVIGDENMWSFEIVVMDTDAHIILDSNGSLINPNKAVIIGNHVWVGCRNTILKGSLVPDGCIMGAGGVLTKKLETPDSIYHGNQLVRNSISWKRTRNLNDPAVSYLGDAD